MSSWIWVGVGSAGVVAAPLLALLVVSASRQRRSDHLRRQFKSEYVRVVREAPSRAEAEKELSERAERLRELHLRPLPHDSSERYAERWRMVQARFVDDPGGAVRDADRLVQEVILECGYPSVDFDQRASDVSVEHPEVVANYRAAHDIYENQLRGSATTEELRHAIVDYRALVDELLAGEVALVR